MLEVCVRSVLREAVPAPQIIVVDNGSRDGSIENLKRAVENLTFVQNNCNAGFARAVNQGIRQASAGIHPAPEQRRSTSSQARCRPLPRPSTLCPISPSPWRPASAIPMEGYRALLPHCLPSRKKFCLCAALKLISPHRFRRKTNASEAHRSRVRPRRISSACAVPFSRDSASSMKITFSSLKKSSGASARGASARKIYYLPAARAAHAGGQTANRFRGPSRVEYPAAPSRLSSEKRTAPPRLPFGVPVPPLPHFSNQRALCSPCLYRRPSFLNKRLRP